MGSASIGRIVADAVRVTYAHTPYPEFNIAGPRLWDHTVRVTYAAIVLPIQMPSSPAIRLKSSACSSKLNGWTYPERRSSETNASLQRSRQPVGYVSPMHYFIQIQNYMILAMPTRWMALWGTLIPASRYVLFSAQDCHSHSM